MFSCPKYLFLLPFPFSSSSLPPITHLFLLLLFLFPSFLFISLYLSITSYSSFISPPPLSLPISSPFILFLLFSFFSSYSSFPPLPPSSSTSCPTRFCVQGLKGLKSPVRYTEAALCTNFSSSQTYTFIRVTAARHLRLFIPVSQLINYQSGAMEAELITSPPN
jgi:hypothetical protein